MYVQDVARNATTVRLVLSSLAALLQLTSYRYPVSEIVTDGAYFDYIVVGAGSAGSVVANRLSEDPKVSVLLIEAGGDPPIESNLPAFTAYALQSRLDWNHTSQEDKKAFQCLKNNRLPLDHGKVLGGTSSINGMMYVRGDPHDYDTWAALTNDSSWSYASILPYFKKSERLEDFPILNSPYSYFHGTEGYLGVTQIHNSKLKTLLEVFREMGYNTPTDTNGYNTLGFSPSLITVADGIRQSTANAFLSSIKDRPNLHVMKDSLATKILVDNFKSARGVQVIDDSKKIITVNANKEIIISAGAINTPQLLMLSGIGPKDKLKELNIKIHADLPVGKRLLDHKAGILIIKMGKSNDKPAPYLDPHDFSIPLLGGYIALNASQRYPDYQVIANSVNDQGAASICSQLLSFNDEICEYFYEKTKGHDVLFLILTNFDRKSRGHVSLKSLNPEDPPSVYIKPFPDDDDLEKFMSYINDISRVVNTTYMKSVGAEIVKLPKCEDFSVTSKDYWRCYMQCLTSTYYHFSGTCAMRSVVNSRLEVYGIKRLRVADAGIMPTITSGNINAPTIMIGEKAADMIKEDNRARA